MNLFQKDKEAPSSCETEYLAIALTLLFGVHGKSALGSGSHTLRLRQEGGRAGGVVSPGWCLSLLLTAGPQQPVSSGVLPCPPSHPQDCHPSRVPISARWPCSPGRATLLGTGSGEVLDFSNTVSCKPNKVHLKYFANHQGEMSEQHWRHLCTLQNTGRSLKSAICTVESGGKNARIE